MKIGGFFRIKNETISLTHRSESEIECITGNSDFVLSIRRTGYSAKIGFHIKHATILATLSQ